MGTQSCKDENQVFFISIFGWVVFQILFGLLFYFSIFTVASKNVFLSLHGKY